LVVGKRKREKKTERERDPTVNADLQLCYTAAAAAGADDDACCSAGAAVVPTADHNCTVHRVRERERKRERERERERAAD
jgi:hypothetical protein